MTSAVRANMPGIDEHFSRPAGGASTDGDHPSNVVVSIRHTRRAFGGVYLDPKREGEQSMMSRLPKFLSSFACLVLLVLAMSLPAREVEDFTEFLQGSRQTYRSDEEPKAQGLRLQFDYPSSWRSAPGKRPNVLVQVTSGSGKGLEICNLIVRRLDLPAGQPLSEADIDDAFANDSLREMIPKGSLFLSGERTTIDGLPAAMAEFRAPMDRAGIEMNTQSLVFFATFDAWFLQFGCSVGDRASVSATEIDARYRKFVPLFKQMANSIVVLSRWNGVK